MLFDPGTSLPSLARLSSCTVRLHMSCSSFSCFHSSLLLCPPYSSVARCYLIRAALSVSLSCWFPVIFPRFASACMCLCIRVKVQVSVSVHLGFHVFLCVCVRAVLCLSDCIQVCISACVCTCMWVCMCLCFCLCACVLHVLFFSVCVLYDSLSPPPRLNVGLRVCCPIALRM